LKAATVPASSNTLSPLGYKTSRQLKLIVALQITVSAIHKRVSLFSNAIENNINVYKKQRERERDRDRETERQRDRETERDI